MESINSVASLSALVFEAMNARDFSGLEPFLNDDSSIDFPGAGLIQGKKKGFIFLNILLRKYPELKFTIREIITSDDRGCVVWSNEGRDAAGKPYTNRGMTLIHFVDGRISFISDYFKDTSFAR